jgi:hypothetical protein
MLFADFLMQFFFYCFSCNKHLLPLCTKRSGVDRDKCEESNTGRRLMLNEIFREAMSFFLRGLNC